MSVETSSPRKLDNSTSLAVDRTRLAYERTLMAWIRTATSLITFGFTIYKFFQIELAKTNRVSNSVIGPTQFALLMIVIGLVCLLFATLEHRRDLNTLDAEFGRGRRSLARILAALISLLGLFAVASILFRQ